jgi:hypothetical protein
LARVQPLICFSRLSEAARSACGSTYTSCTGRRRAVWTEAQPLLCASVVRALPRFRRRRATRRGSE